MFVSIISEKGGTGKTTLCVNLAIMRAIATSDVVTVVDTDPQRNATSFFALRNHLERKPAIKYLAVDRNGFSAALEEYNPDVCDVLFDFAGRNSPEMQESLRVVQKAVVVITPSQFDLWTIKKMYRLVSEARQDNRNLGLLTVINQAHTHPLSRENQLVMELLSQLSSEIAPLIIRNRVIFERSIPLGLSVVEMTPLDHKASMEIEQVYHRLFG